MKAFEIRKGVPVLWIILSSMKAFEIRKGVPNFEIAPIGNTLIYQGKLLRE